jgi:DNA-binding transcriptional MocR family regulator
MGVSMTLDRRREVLEIAHQHDLLLVEDDLRRVLVHAQSG